MIPGQPDPAAEEPTWWESAIERTAFGGTAIAAARGENPWIPVAGESPALAEIGLLLLTLIGTLALVGLAAALIIAGLLALLGFGPGDVAKLTPPGRVAALAEVAVSPKG